MLPRVEFHFDFGSATFFVGDEMFFGKDRLREVEEEVVSLTHPTR